MLKSLLERLKSEFGFDDNTPHTDYQAISRKLLSSDIATVRFLDRVWDIHREEKALSFATDNFREANTISNGLSMIKQLESMLKDPDLNIITHYDAKDDLYHIVIESRSLDGVFRFYVTVETLREQKKYPHIFGGIASAQEPLSA